MVTRRRLVVVSIAAIHPPRRGNQIRTASLLAHLGDHWDVESFSLMIQRTDLPVPRATIPVTARWTDHRTRDPLMTAWTAVAARAGYPPVHADRVLRLWPHGALRAALAHADAALVAPPYPFGWVRGLAPADLPVVLDEHSIEADMYRHRGSRWTRHVAASVDRCERQAIGAADLVFVTCDADAETVRAAGARQVALVPNGVDLRRFAPGTEAAKHELRHGLGLPTDGALGVFVGSGHPPNVEAVATLEQQAGRYAAAGIHLVVVGRCGIGRPAVGNVVHVGGVPDVVPYLRAADVALCPLVSGSGTSLKSIEYLATGVPLVTTPFGVRGLGIAPGTDAEVCSLDEMPERAGALIGDPARMGALAAAARATSLRFGWSNAGAAATGALDGLVAGGRQHG